MKKKIVLMMTLLVFAMAMAGCREAARVSYNISKEADNFEVLRELTVMDDFTGEIMFSATGYMSIEEDGTQLEITSKDVDKNGKVVYKKHFAGRSQFTSYTLVDITGTDVSTTKFTLIFNPDMIIPFEVKTR
ncbi:putative membrane protein [Clostridiales Family XIII bacterium PM5-7]